MINSTSDLFLKFSGDYALIHGRIVFPLTILGILTSLVTIIILNRKSFQTPTNFILQTVAFFDTIVLISFNIYSFYFYILHDPNPFVGQSKFWPCFAIIHSNVGLTAHSIALWLTCLLAIIRYMIISQPSHVVIRNRDVNICIGLICVTVCLLMIPSYLSWRVVREPAWKYFPDRYDSNSSEFVYWLSSVTGKRLEKISFGILAICFKILPVLVLIIFSILLILNIRHAKVLRENLRRRCSSINSRSNLQREMRTTTMLLLITLCTVVVEFPQGLLLSATGIDKNVFQIYSRLGDFWDILTISSSFITFVMYCSMSQQFRLEIVKLILPEFILKKCHLSPNQSLSQKSIRLKPLKPQTSPLVNHKSNQFDSQPI